MSIFVSTQTHTTDPAIVSATYLLAIAAGQSLRLKAKRSQVEISMLSSCWPRYQEHYAEQELKAFSGDYGIGGYPQQEVVARDMLNSKCIDRADRAPFMS